MVASVLPNTVAPNSVADEGAQADLADSLVECMGLDSAIHVCQVNGWDGVLDVLLQRRDGDG